MDLVSRTIILSIYVKRTERYALLTTSHPLAFIHHRRSPIQRHVFTQVMVLRRSVLAAKQPPQPQPRLAQTPPRQCIVSTSARALNNRIKGLTDIPFFAKVLELADWMKLGGQPYTYKDLPPGTT
jgi:hypothetical protein